MTGMARKVLCCGLAMLVALSGALFCFAEDDTERPPKSWQRIAGANRYETSLLIGNAIGRWLNSTPPIYEKVVIASGIEYADALGSAGLQGTRWGPAPILLVNNDRRVMTTVAEDIREHFDNNSYPLTRDLVILGGEGAVSREMEAALKKVGIPSYMQPSPLRFAGANRFETNLKLLYYFAPSIERPLIICSGSDFADALSASAAKCSVMLVGDALTDGQAEYIEVRVSRGGKACVIAGGTGAVSEGIENELRKLGLEPVRLAGKDRYETSYLMAEYFFPGEGFSAVLAYGRDYPDGLCGGPLATSLSAPLILVDNEHYIYAEQYMQDHSLVHIKVLGGSALISDETVERIINASDL